MKIFWWCGLLLYVPFFILALIVAPLLPLFAFPQDGPINNGKGRGVEPRLPRWLSWFQTPDNSLWGDQGWQQDHCPKHYKDWWGMTCWLWRNPAYGLAWGPLAYTPGPDTTYVTTGDPTIHARDNARAGWYCIGSSDGAWEYTSITRICHFQECFKFRYGWILGDAQPGSPCLFLLSVRLMPFRPAPENKG